MNEGSKKIAQADRGGATASLRALELLEVLAAAGEPQALKDLQARIDMPRASLHRMLRALQIAGYLSEDGLRYSIGARGRGLGRLLTFSTRSAELASLARPTLEELSARTNETIILGRLSKSRLEIVYADVIVANSPLQYAVPSGDRRPLYSSATGKSVLAFLPPQEQRRYILDADFKPFTPFTTQREQIDEILENIRSSAVIWEKDGHFIGAGAVASPIFDSAGSVFASVVVAGPNERLERMSEVIRDLVRDAATAISRAVGFSGSYPPPWPPQARDQA